MIGNRLDPSLISSDALEDLARALAQSRHAALVDNEGNRTEIPAYFLAHLTRLVALMRKGRAVVLIPDDEAFTTQAAANYLGVSRQHFVDLLESGKLPFHKVGSHRRVVFRNLLAYEKQRDQARRHALDRLARSVDEAGFYEADYTGDE